MKLAFVVLISLMCCGLVLAEDLVVVGRLVQNEPMDYVEDECPENYICLHSWWRSVVNVQKTIRGPALNGRIVAANMQHTSLDPGFKKDVRLFVLKPIDDQAQRAKLRAEYYLEDMSEPRKMFCLSQDPKELGLDAERTYVAGRGDAKTHCFELPAG